MANTSLPNLTERTATANTDLIHVNSGGTDYKETKANFLSDVNSSITSLNNSLTKYYDAPAVASVTIGSSGYTELSRPSAVVGKRILAISVLNWSTASGAFNAAILRDTGARYMIYGTPNVTITNLALRWVYQD